MDPRGVGGRVYRGLLKKQPSSRKSSSRGRTAQEKLGIVLKEAALSGDEFGAFLRRDGLHESQLEEWRAKAMEAATGAFKAPDGKRSEGTPEFARSRSSSTSSFGRTRRWPR